MKNLKRATLWAAPASLFLIAGCVQAPKQMYLWENFPKHQYSTLLHEETNPADQIRSLEAQADKARASNTALPPGFRAHMGMLHLELGDPDAARQMWEAEKIAFPESAPFMNRLLGRLGGPTKVAPKENPA